MMNLMGGYKANKAIETILAQEDIGSAAGKQAVATIKKIGNSSIPKLLEALGSSKDTGVIQNLLIGFLSSATLPLFIDALASKNQRVIDGVTHILSRSQEYDPNRLLEHFANADISKTALGAILLAQKERVNVNILLSLVDKVSSNTRPVIYKILDQIVTEEDLASVISKTKVNEPMVRTYLVSLLGRFSTIETNLTLVKILQDPNKNVRQAALKALAEQNATHNTQAICQLLRDPDLTVQSVAIDALAKINAADTVKFLIEILQDDSEYIRRAAVEVLNEVGDERAIKDLLNALRDVDWWVKVRAADALGTIGGPKVFDAILALITDKDEFMRRTAVEILNTCKDPKSFDKLVLALKDEDWWVRERAADALASLGDTRAVEPLVSMLENTPDGRQIVIRALGTLGDKRAIKPILKRLKDNDDAVRKEALNALQILTDEEHADVVQHAVTQLINTKDHDVTSIANQTMTALISRFGSQAFENYDFSSDVDENSSAQHNVNVSVRKAPFVTIGKDIIDAALLRLNDVFAKRYRVIKQVGKGAFGVVVLVEDMTVHDQFILKFLNPHVAIDSLMIKRFTHELRYARKITHKNVIRIYDLITQGRSYAISMEYFPSHPLTAELVSGDLIETNHGVNIIKQVCKGMSAAQNVNVVHRDLKPGNILINENNLIKTVDFGLAAAASSADSRLTKTGVLVGTPTYMAPEQVRGKKIDSRTDIYSTGIIMYEMFTGQVPYTGEDSMGIMFQHVEGKPLPPRALVPEISEMLEGIILKAMSVEKNDRYAHFDELLADLDQLPEVSN